MHRNGDDVGKENFFIIIYCGIVKIGSIFWSIWFGVIKNRVIKQDILQNTFL
jgi:hypothetical protein